MKGTEVESIGLEIDEPVLPPRRHIFAPNVDDDIQYSSAFTRHTPKNEIPSQQRNRLSPSSYRQLPPPPPPLPGFNASYIPGSQRIIEEETQPFVIVSNSVNYVFPLFVDLNPNEFFRLRIS